jgi:DNA-binding transcriptional MerR regulator/methylmalonyl-CoA mutase cobalamin-binding subunit
MLNIGVVERETGIGKDTLRVWERRYGFPIPVRGEREDRLYPEDQVDRLRLIKRLLDMGLRPAKVVALEQPALVALLEELTGQSPGQGIELQEYLQLVRQHQFAELRLALSRGLLEQGLNDFLSKTISPLNLMIGESWLRGEIRVFEEHLYSEQLTAVLRSAIEMMRNERGTPHVFFATLPGEEHTLGLLMAEATLSLQGARCTLLGAQAPINEIVAAATAHQVDVVVVSFSLAMMPQKIKDGLQQLRRELPTQVAIWAGGAGVARSRNMVAGVKLMGPLSDLIKATDEWFAHP